VDEEMETTCYGCGIEDKPLKHYDIGRSGWLCALCAATPCGNAAFYPEQYSNQDILKTMVLLTWAILDNKKRK